MLWNMAFNAENQVPMYNDQVVIVLVKLLRTKSISMAFKEYAAGAICNLATAELNKPLMVQDGAATVLFPLLSSGSKRFTELACAALCNLSSCFENQISMYNAGVLRYVLPVLTMGSPLYREYCASLICNLSIQDVHHIPMMHDDGVVEALLPLLADGTIAKMAIYCLFLLFNDFYIGTVQFREHTAGIIWNLSLAEQNKNKLVSIGVINKLIPR